MTCGGCEKAVRTILGKTAGVEKVDVVLSEKKVYVTGTASTEEMINAIKKIGKPVTYVGIKN